MIDFKDPRIKKLHGAYHIQYDVSHALNQIEANGASQVVWDELWNNLHHQGQIGEASFAAIPYLAALIKKEKVRDWNIYALAGIIELYRNINDNPDVPDWLALDYRTGLNEILEMGLDDLKKSIDVYSLRSILGFIALMKGSRDFSRLLLELDESEIKEILSEYA